MALPKFSELSTAVQMAVIAVVGIGLWGVSEYLHLQPLEQDNSQKQEQATQLENQNRPLREYVPKHRQLIAENQQLEAQLENLKRIVPSEKEVDNFVRQIEGEANTTGVMLRRFTSKTTVPQEFHVEVPFELELDGPYYDVLQFYDKLGRLEGIINVSELKMGSIEAKRSVGNKQYAYSPSETVVAVCTVTTFFSREGEPETTAAARPGQPARPPQGPGR